MNRRVRWFSTRSPGAGVSFVEALFRGLAPDGGLYLPRPLTPLDVDAVLEARSFQEVSMAMARHLLAPVPDEVLERAVTEAFDFPVRLTGPVGGVPGADARPYLLELFHGPSMAFKDLGARFMAALMSRLDPDPDPARPRTVLVATSGDTGGAVAHAFHDIVGFRVVVLFPRGGVSPVQRRLFTTLGGNVTALAVPGSFDDCQAMVKDAFAAAGTDPELRLTSANSINVGRLVPQTFYYAEALRLLRDRGAAPGAVFSVPSGNLGNLTGGMLARRLGLPVLRLIAATNRNDAFRRWLEEGDDRARPPVSTPSNAMDVASPSNLERVRLLVEDDRHLLAREVSAWSFDDDATLDCMARVRRRDDYLVDPHSAVALLGAEAWLGDAADPPPVVALGTAHPAKFPDLVRRAGGRAPPPPASLGRTLGNPEKTTAVPPTVDALLEVLRDGARTR